jgi:hypothetical protein
MPAAKPLYLDPKLWVGGLSTLGGLGLTFAAAFGAPVGDLEVANQVLVGVASAAEQVATGAGNGQLIQGIFGAVMSTLPTVVFLVNKYARKGK